MSSRNVAQTPAEVRVTTDDRAQLLPGVSKDSPCSDTQVKSCVVSSFNGGRDVYTITDESLPAHMRSLLPSHEQHVHDLLTLQRTRRRLRHVIAALALLLVLTVLVGVTLVFSLKVDDDPPLRGGWRGAAAGGQGGVAERGYGKVSSRVSKVATEVKISLLNRDRRPPRVVYRHRGPRSQRTPCVTECWTYAAFRFRSVCELGYCRCHGDDYDTNSCLPKYHRCRIERRLPKMSEAKLLGKNQTTYGCRAAQPRDSSGVHVISIFGNHRAPSTHVTVLGQSYASNSNTLVLVNYHYVKWTVRLPKDSGISKVFVVSMKSIWQAHEVDFPDTPAGKPEVVHALSLTGYGQDRNGGHTPQLLQFIEKEIGPIASFLGASHADDITLDLKSNGDYEAELPTQSVTSSTSATSATSAASATSDSLEDTTSSP